MIPFAIARQTVREALRRRVMWIFLVSGVFLIALGPVFGFLSPERQPDHSAQSGPCGGSAGGPVHYDCHLHLSYSG